ncbi:pyrroline-5-carboxylate reductase [Bythopirellula polymerisocia]|uniref:Pyrroline-5-carboxylate reductase n=1 Tax=Bythopirellula polymerisocia TaxID=2528003 RepID=A0A5C6CI41_9BACT|nr:pyrroline-5-carboxylate reductase [Bythopirellula polymerisocia]TWU23745.1 Pyrroline-5-carboxylate reductase [Bythopirellula polymerisocia]
MPEFTKSVGFIGAGRMATALARGCVESGLMTVGQLISADPSLDARHAFADQVAGVAVFDTNEPILARADIIVLAIKPQVMPDVLADIGNQVTEQQLVVSIAAGVTLKKLAKALPTDSRLIRVMPNTPCLVGEGASCFSRGSSATDEDAEDIRLVLESVGRVFEVAENQLDAVTGLSGSGPAFVYKMIEALAQGGTQMGLPEELALELASQTAKGAAQMVLTTGLSPAALREQVTSPGGTTVAGLEALAKLEGAEAFREAVVAATKRSQELGES